MASSASSTLRLVFEKGPRSGETREFNPRSKVRIGRIVKGNNLQIKDDAISSQHLTIEFNSGSGKWVITDLESSNGTHLNSSKLKPLSPFELCDGDEIKIGDSTSISVGIVEIAGEICERRNPRRKAGPKGGADLGAKVEEVVDEECPNLGEGGSVRVRVRVGVQKGENVEKGIDTGENLGIENRKGRGRGRAKKENAENVGVIPNVEEDVKPKQEQRMATRRTRNSKREGDEFLSLEKVMPVRRTRGAKNVEKVTENEALDVGNCKEVENVGIVESKKTRGRGRKKKVEVENSENVKDVVLDDTTTREVSQVEVPDVREEPREEQIDDTVQPYSLEGEVTEEVAQLKVLDEIEEPHEEQIGDTGQPYSLEGKVTEEVSQLKVLDVIEEPHEEPIGDTVQPYSLEGKVPEKVSQPKVLDEREEPHEEPMGNTVQETPLEDKMNIEVSEAEVPEQVVGELDVKEQSCEQPIMDDMACENDNGVNASHFEQDTSERLENDMVLEGGKVENTEVGETSEELDTEVDKGEEEQESESLPNLEKMTLGEWLDYLEVYIPKHINSVRDEIIEDMRKRAKQCDDFMLQQQNEKGKKPSTT